MLVEFNNVRVILLCSSYETRRSLEQTFSVIANDTREAGRENQMKSLDDSFKKYQSSTSCNRIAMYVEKIMGRGSNSNIFNYHVYKALEHDSQLVAQHFSARFKESLETTPTKMEIDQVGLLNGQGKFIYDSFKDYFNAKFYSLFWSGKLDYESEFASDIAVDFITKVARTDPEAKHRLS